MSGHSNVALVTGASSGIGRELARLLAESGRDLFIVARSAGRLEQVAAEIREEYGATVFVLAEDLTISGAVERVTEAVASRSLSVDVLVNSAGVGLLGRFHETDANQQRDLLRLNIEALVNLTHSFLPAMVERSSGAILNVASMAAFTPGPLMATYYASKAFVLAFGEGLERELKGTGVSVTTLCPGPVPTGFQARAGFSPQSGSRMQTVSARAVAEAGMKGVMKGKRVVVPGFLNKILAFTSRVVPRGITADAVYRVQSSRLEAAQS